MGRGTEMAGCGKFVQMSMFIANFIIWVGSIAILVLGIWAVVDRPYLEGVMGQSVYISAAYILIAVGVLTFLISFLGCFGALKEIKCMLLTYFIVVLILCIVLLVGGILGFMFMAQAEKKLEMSMKQSLNKYNIDEKNSPITRSWDDAQMAMKCCGINSRNDWRALKVNLGSNRRVPKSCCRKEEDSDERMNCEFSPNDINSYSEGCLAQAKQFVMKHAHYIGGAGIGVAVLMVLGLVFSMILFKLIN